jgi:bifunctional DNA-binding transcriptional regulator/antitoxin component of YhaV-PrlF toxin-antitoxin module
MVEKVTNKEKNPTEKARINAKYQLVIPRRIRRVVKDVAAGREAYITAIDDETIQIKLKKTSWVDRYGGILPKGYYGKDATKYIKDLRDEWDA